MISAKQTIAFKNLHINDKLIRKHPTLLQGQDQKLRERWVQKH